MRGSSDPELLRRLIEFELSLERDAAEVVEEFDWGRLILNPETPAIWSGNYLEVRSTDLDADQLADLAERTLEPRGIAHRDVVAADPAYADGLASGFGDLEGWGVQRGLYMVLAREPDREVGEAREADRETVVPIRRADLESDSDFTPEAVEQRLLHDARVDRIGNGRWFAAPPEGPPAASCVLFELDGVGQVESVETIPERRGEGLASAVVTAAVAASKKAGHELTFIVADADDWPWKLYERLGFDPVGELRSFLRKPAQLRGDESA
jgi:ribosomal protein S18 acetylase RimI-like enzyme